MEDRVYCARYRFIAEPRISKWSGAWCVRTLARLEPALSNLLSSAEAITPPLRVMSALRGHAGRTRKCTAWKLANTIAVHDCTLICYLAAKKASITVWRA